MSTSDRKHGNVLFHSALHQHLQRYGKQWYGQLQYYCILERRSNSTAGNHRPYELLQHEEGRAESKA